MVEHPKRNRGEVIDIESNSCIVFNIEKITTPSGLEAEVLIQNIWGPERESVGLRYIGECARQRLSEVFLNDQPMFDLRDIAADMQEHKFGYIDNVRIPLGLLAPNFQHVLPITSVSDDLPNCLWHADKLRLKMVNDTHTILDTSAITFLYANRLDPVHRKETGFGHPQSIADAYNAYYEEPMNSAPVVEGTVESLREVAEVLGEGMDVIRAEENDWQERFICIRDLLQFTYERLETLFEREGIQGMYWIPHRPHRLMVFSNSIAHSNDLVRQSGSIEPRSQAIWRRMLPGRKFMTFNND